VYIYTVHVHRRLTGRENRKLITYKMFLQYVGIMYIYIWWVEMTELYSRQDCHTVTMVSGKQHRAGPWIQDYLLAIVLPDN
jgi:hypothetical protein